MPDDPTDAEIEAILLAADAERWRELLAALADLEAESERADWDGGQEIRTTVVDASGRETLSLPYTEDSDAVRRTTKALYDLGAIVPFDWPHWEGRRRYRGSEGLESAPVADAVRVATAIIRQERFVTGATRNALKDGILFAALRRLRQWHTDTIGPQPSGT